MPFHLVLLTMRRIEKAQALVRVLWIERLAAVVAVVVVVIVVVARVARVVFVVFVVWVWKHIFSRQHQRS